MKISLLVFCLLLVTARLFAQDKLLDRNGTEFYGKVLEIGPETILLNKTEQDSSRLIILPKRTIFMITFANGTKEVFKDQDIIPGEEIQKDYFRLGQQDARANYNAKGAYWVTLGTTLALPVGGPILGLGVGTAATLTNPSYDKIIPSQPEYLSHSEYVRGYNAGAKNMKLGRAAAGLGTGTAILILALTVALSGY